MDQLKSYQFVKSLPTNEMAGFLFLLTSINNSVKAILIKNIKLIIYEEDDSSANGNNVGDRSQSTSLCTRWC